MYYWLDPFSMLLSDKALPLPSAPIAPGEFGRVAFHWQGATHDYWLFVPPAPAIAHPMPLVLMLHGCHQSAEDFAAGTAMNAAAAQAGVLVLYPAQSPWANSQGCWNWFEPQHQRRGTGELALLVAMVDDVAAHQQPLDRRRIYVAGLSAGGAMAALLGSEYPDVFAAIGVHSGVQAKAVRNLHDALQVMDHGPQTDPALLTPGPHLPVIVFHGDLDDTVHARNGEYLVDAVLADAIRRGVPLQRRSCSGQSAAGQAYTRTVYWEGHHEQMPDRVLVEHWQLHAGGHAWAGGSAQGSYTDPNGVNASQEMLRFFLQHPALHHTP
jgi:poly(hydroxyalkanoate) depolymerase family esterase